MKSENDLLVLLKEKLNPNDVVVHSIIGSREREDASMGVFEFLESKLKKAILVAMDDRVIYFAKTITGFRLEEFPYDQISALNVSRKIMGHKVQVTGFNTSRYIKWVKDPDLVNFQKYVSAKMNENKGASRGRK